jgi:hypothetical protein
MGAVIFTLGAVVLAIAYCSIRIGVRIGSARAVKHIARGFLGEIGDYPSLGRVDEFAIEDRLGIPTRNQA